MSGVSPRSLAPALLPLGTVVAGWRVVGWAGSGTHGVVYRAVAVDAESAAPVALKLARSVSGEETRSRWWLATAAVVLTLAVWTGGMVLARWAAESSIAQAVATRASQADGGTAGLGEAAASASAVDAPEPALQEAMAGETLPEPVPEQVRPDGKGRCPHRRQVALKGVCWLPLGPEECEALGADGQQLFKGKCYVPVRSRNRPSTSHPTMNP